MLYTETGALMTEHIKFEFLLHPEYWDRPPHASILVDGVEHWSGLVEDKLTATFSVTLDFNTPHLIELVRSGKDDSQCREADDGSLLDQLLTLKQVKVDGIDIRDIVWAYSWSEPTYPEPWASEQRALGTELEEKVLGETVFGHNTTWKLQFTSPFYEYLMNWMDGKL